MGGDMKRTLTVVFLALVLSGCRPDPVVPASNSMLVIMPYKHAGTWVFDEPRLGLEQEPFVVGIPRMIDRLVTDIPDADQGFRLIFSAQEFPGYTHKLLWRRKESGGNWYYCPRFDEEGWLCPALLKFFREAPKEIYVKAEEK